mgnify:FL=1
MLYQLEVHGFKKNIIKRINMIAVAESGSTKTQWFIISSNGTIKQEISTRGFNPDFHDSKFIELALLENEEINFYSQSISLVYFFGASCSSTNNINKVKGGLQSIFKNAEIQVEHDLSASAYALYQGNPVISCIIGTGSNSVLFDGVKMFEEIPALGFFLGDECSGAYFGKQLLKDFFYKKLPVDIHDALIQDYNLEWNKVREIIYGSKDANVFLASFMPFIMRYKGSAYIDQLLNEGIKNFIDLHIDCFAAYNCKEVGFVGSIAGILKHSIQVQLEAKGYKLGKIIHSPGRDLVNYLLQERKILDSKVLESKRTTLK